MASSLAFLVVHAETDVERLDLIIGSSAFPGWGCFLLGDGVLNLKLMDQASDFRAWKWLRYAESGLWGAHLPSCEKRGITQKLREACSLHFPCLHFFDSEAFQQALSGYRRVVCFSPNES